MNSASFEIKGEKRWRILDDLSPEAVAGKEALTQALGIDPVVSRLLWNRGYRTPEDAKAYFSLANETLGNPFDLADMKNATDRIKRALSEREKITIYGDYDADGVTSVSILWLYLHEKGGEVSYYIPDRIRDGYGVSADAIEKIARDGTKLIITVDTGISAHAEVERAKEVGVDIVVTDHHECGKSIPNAAAVVNPKRPDCPYPFKSLAGVGVVFKLLCALEEVLSGVDRITAVNTVALSCCDLVALGTIADVVPVVGENRLLVKLGLEMIEKRPRPSIAALLDLIGTKSDQRDRKKKKQAITSQFISFNVSPRINAVGRVRSASLAVEFLLADTSQRARELAQVLCDTNRERQEEEARIERDVYATLEAEHDFEKDPVIVLCSDEWHCGVIGVVASHVTEHVGLPSILISFRNKEEPYPSPDDVGRGSGRSVKGLNLFEALSSCSDILTKSGGHELAAGFSIKRRDFSEFKERINAYARERITRETIVQTFEADCELTGEEITLPLVEEISQMEPFGTDNPSPFFVSRGFVVRQISPVSGGKHVRMVVGAGDLSFDAMFFRTPESSLDVYVGEKIDLYYSLGINEYAGRRSVQLIVRDSKRSDETVGRTDLERVALTRILAGEKPDGIDVQVPDRGDFVAVYRLIRDTVSMGEKFFSIRATSARLTADPSTPFGYLKLCLILRIFEETGLIRISSEGEDLIKIDLEKTDGKVDLEHSTILANVKRFASE